MTISRGVVGAVLWGGGVMGAAVASDRLVLSQLCTIVGFFAGRASLPAHVTGVYHCQPIHGVMSSAGDSVQWPLLPFRLTGSGYLWTAVEAGSRYQPARTGSLVSVRPAVQTLIYSGIWA